MFGNVFLITSEKRNSHSNLNAYLRYLNQKLKKEKLSVEKVLKPKQVSAIKNALNEGDLRLATIDDRKNYDFLRKISLIYIKEINHGQNGFTRKQFRKRISDKDEEGIVKALRSKYPNDSQEDVNFSADQSDLLKQSIKSEDISEFPSIFNDENKLDVDNTYNFFVKLSKIFNWRLYERKFVNTDADKKTQQKTLEDYAKLTLLWISGYSLREICGFAIEIRKNDPTFLDRLNRDGRLAVNIDWNTITINTVMRQLNKLNFVLGKYFLKIAKELSANHLQLENNWYRYLEYGTDSELRIWLQQNGYSRESSQFIEANSEKLIIDKGSFGWLIAKAINEVDDFDVVNETKEIQTNVPEIFN